MKQILILISTLVIVASCGTTKCITYGDVTVMNTEGEVVRQYVRSVLDISEYDHSGKIIYKSFSLTNGGLKFTDGDGISHYVSGGIVIVDNIITESSNSTTDTDIEKLESELKQLKSTLSEKKKYLKSNKSKMTEEQVKAEKNAIKTIQNRIDEIETLLYPDTSDN